VSLGRKVAQYEAKSQLGTYSLDIRLNQDGNEFVIVVPCAPGAKAERSDPVVRAPTLAEAKQKVADLLKARDVPGFEDVIEYSCPTRERWAGEDDTHASFDFRVARVSTSRDPRVNRPLVEIGVEVSEKGEISEEVSGMTGEEAVALARESFAFIAGYEGPIPGASAAECGNWLDHDLAGARAEAAAYLPVLESWSAESLAYPA